MRALIIEDDPGLCDLVSQSFTAQGFAVEVAHDGESGLTKAAEAAVDIAVIDLGLPGISGVETIRRARRAGWKFPILILTAQDGWQSKVEGLEAGADDYLVKPFQSEELLARCRAMLRRAGLWSPTHLQCGPIVVDTSAQTVTVQGQPVELTAYEYKILEYLVLHTGEVVSKGTLTRQLYADDEARGSNVLEVFIGRLRSKLDPALEIKPISTIRGSGYRWNIPRGAMLRPLLATMAMPAMVPEFLDLLL